MIHDGSALVNKCVVRGFLPLLQGFFAESSQFSTVLSTKKTCAKKLFKVYYSYAVIKA